MRILHLYYDSGNPVHIKPIVVSQNSYTLHGTEIKLVILNYHDGMMSRFIANYSTDFVFFFYIFVLFVLYYNFFNLYLKKRNKKKQADKQEKNKQKYEINI